MPQKKAFLSRLPRDTQEPKQLSTTVHLSFPSEGSKELQLHDGT